MNQELVKLLKELSETPGPSGNEKLVKRYIVEKIKKYSDTLIEDPIGNLISKTGKGNYRVGILSHMDEVGMIVTKINFNGTIGFSIIGIIDPRNLQGCLLNIINKDDELIQGVIGAKSRHLMSKEELDSPITAEQMTIDIGARSQEEVHDYSL